MFLQQGGPGDCCLLSFTPAKSQNPVSERIGSTMAAVLYRPAFGESYIESQKSFWNSSNFIVILTFVFLWYDTSNTIEDFRLFLLKVLPLAELVHLPLVAQLTTDSSMVGGNQKHDGGNPKHDGGNHKPRDNSIDNLDKRPRQSILLDPIIRTCNGHENQMTLENMAMTNMLRSGKENSSIKMNQNRPPELGAFGVGVLTKQGWYQRTV